VRFTRRDGDDRVIDSTGRRWTITEPALVPPAGPETKPLPRIPAFRAFWFGWYAQFPETALTGGGR
jgi:hypothetical protein